MRNEAVVLLFSAPTT